MTESASPRVFISYAHDSSEHKLAVLKLSDRLRADGVDCLIDQYVETPECGWPRWTQEQVENAKFVLVVASAGYAQ